MKKLLVPCDGSEGAAHAVRHAAARACAEPATAIHLLHVIKPMTPVALSEALSSDRLDERFPPQAAMALEPAVAVVTQAGIPCVLHCRFGAPASEIAACTRDTAFDEVVMDTRGRGALASLVLGSVTAEVAALVELPLTVVGEAPRPAAPDAAQKILVPIDGSQGAQRALRYAAARAGARPGMRLELLHVLDPTTSRAYLGLPPQELARRAPEAFHHVLRPARDFLDSAGIPYETHCRVGDPATQIAGHLADAGSAGVVMGTRGLGAAGNLLIGSVASRVVYYAHVPVTLVK